MNQASQVSSDNQSSAKDRRWSILQTVQSRQQVSVAELSKQFGVSEVSIRRDLVHLEEAGLLQRVHGGAQVLFRRGITAPFDARSYQNTDRKQAIGEAAARLIKPGDVVMLDAGTTVLEVARHIPSTILEDGSLTVVTRSLAVGGLLHNQRHTRLLVMGGMYVPDFDTFVGPLVEHALQNIHVNTLFIGIDGISIARGVTTDNVLEASLYPAMTRCADRVVVVTDSSKIGINRLQAILPLEQISTLITDDQAPVEFINALGEHGIDVVTVAIGSPQMERNLP